MPTARAGAACAVADQKLVVCGGLVMAWQVLDVVEAFDPSVRKWRRLPAMPTPRCGCCACGVKGQILVMGGQLADGTVLDKVELLDLQRLVWDRLPAMPSPRSGGGCGLVGPERSGPGAVVYLLGGLGASGLTVPVVDRLDLEEGGEGGGGGRRKWKGRRRRKWKGWRRVCTHANQPCGEQVAK
eukprot:g23267.t1